VREEGKKAGVAGGHTTRMWGLPTELLIVSTEIPQGKVSPLGQEQTTENRGVPGGRDGSVSPLLFELLC